MKICIDTVIFIDILKDEYPKTQEKFYNALEDGHTLVASELQSQNSCLSFRETEEIEGYIEHISKI